MSGEEKKSELDQVQHVTAIMSSKSIWFPCIIHIILDHTYINPDLFQYLALGIY